MSSDLITLAKNVDTSKITYATPKALDSGARMIYMYHNSKPFIIQTPELIAPYGISRWQNERGPDKLNLDLSFGNGDNKDSTEFFELVKSIDDKLITDGLENAQNWFKKKLATREIVEALYSPLIKYAKDKETGENTDKYPPTMRFQLPVNKDGVVTCEVYDQHCRKVSIDDVDFKRAKVTGIAQCSGIWCAGGKYGCTFKLLQIKVKPNTRMFTKYAFVEDDDDV